ncbi:MAG: endonuclease MutS2 [candidate division KSB1 bacterium]|nr:endonuclease MutS2 [candidate division KSB1 bacterium]MDZ7345352.1 endonuclease MutS2 [candidate division KSB1 bacterium]
MSSAELSAFYGLYHTIEFDSILAKVKSLLYSVPAEELLAAVEPLSLPQRSLELTRVTEMRRLLDFYQPPPFETLTDVRPLLKKAQIRGSLLSLHECLDIHRLLFLVRRLADYFHELDSGLDALREIVSRLRPIKALEDEIIRCLDPATLEVRDQASPALTAVRRAIRQAEAAAHRKMEEQLRRLAAEGVLQENIIAVRNGRLVLVVKEEHRRKVKGLVHDRSSTGASFFIEPLEVVEDNNRIRELYAEEEREIEKVLRALTDEIRRHLPNLEESLAAFSELDFIHAKAVFSQKIGGCAPELCEEPMIRLRKARHPLLLLRLGINQIVPLDVDLDEERRILIISGPNAGGKTVALKTIGLLALMTLCGFHIPAAQTSCIGEFGEIRAAIGDEQSLENDLSTFSSHVQKLNELAQAKPKSLLLVDEIGVGTDPEEGAALATAFLEKFAENRCLAVVTTHYGALKAFGHQAPYALNASMEFDAETLQPTFHFRSGIPGSSYAFEIAKRYGVPNDLIERARSLVGAQKSRLEELILELDQKVQQYKKLVREADLRETEYRGLLKLYEEKNKNLERELKAVKRRAAEEAEAILTDANRLVEQTIREIRESQAEKQTVQAVRAKMKEQLERVRKIKEETQPAEMVEAAPAEPLAEGSLVIWKQTGASGRIISAPDKKNRVIVQFDGGVKATLPLNELVKGKSRSITAQPTRVFVYEEKPFKPEIDLRGLSGEEAVEQTAKFIDEALVRGLGQISVIHGKGTGKLRKTIADFLRSHPQVVEFRLGNWNEGGDGVTVVYFTERPKEMERIDEQV